MSRNSVSSAVVRSSVRRCERKRSFLFALLSLTIPHAPYPFFFAIRNSARLQREYAITQEVDVDGVLSVVELAQHEQGPMLVCEDFSGIMLETPIATERVALSTFLHSAVQLADTLGEIHRRNIIHQHIKPGTILYNPVTGRVKVTGFSPAIPNIAFFGENPGERRRGPLGAALPFPID